MKHRRRRRRKNPGLPAPLKAAGLAVAGTLTGVLASAVGILVGGAKPANAIRAVGALGALGGMGLAMRWPCLGTAVATGALDAAAQPEITSKVVNMLTPAAKAAPVKAALKSRLGDALELGMGDVDESGNDMAGLTAENMQGLTAENMAAVEQFMGAVAMMNGLTAENMAGDDDDAMGDDDDLGAVAMMDQ